MKCARYKRGQNGQHFFFGLGFASAISIDRIARVAGFVRYGLRAIEHVVGADEKQPGARVGRGLRYIDRAGSIHSESESRIEFAAIHVGVGCCKYDLVWLGLLDRADALRRVAVVRLPAPQASDLSFAPDAAVPSTPPAFAHPPSAPHV